jgi:hypothetical protein
MESFMLLHLAKSSKVKIIATAACIVVANRLSTIVVDHDSLDMMELEGGKALLEALISISL